MMIRAAVIEVFREENIGLGAFDFLQLPAPNDRVFIARAGGIDTMVVLHVEHHPVAVSTPPSERADPSAVVYVSLNFGGGGVSDD
jgi:hypothetical protein